jgi:hypothetical protein
LLYFHYSSQNKQLKRDIESNRNIEIKMSCGCNQQPQNDCKVSPPRKNVERLRDPTPPPIVKREVKRLPTPPGDTIERIRVKRQPQQIIERVTEQPRKPPPKVIERCENEPAPPPIIKESCQLVDPTPRQEAPKSCGCN